MKYTILLAGLLSCVLPCVAAQNELTCKAVELKAQVLNEMNIQEYQKQIYNELEQNNSIRFIAKSAGCIAGLVACYMFYNDFSIVQREELSFLRQDYSRLVSLITAMAETDILKNDQAFQSIKLNTQSHSSGGGWGSFFIRLTGQMVFSSFVGYVSQRILGNIFFDQSVGWFIQEKTLLQDLRNQLLELGNSIALLRMDRVVIAQQESDHYVFTMVRMHNDIVKQLEQIVAYMHYKMSKFSMAKGDCIYEQDTTALYVTERMQAVAEKLNACLLTYKKASDQDERVKIVIEMFDVIKLCMTQITHDIATFVSVEKKMQKVA